MDIGILGASSGLISSLIGGVSTEVLANLYSAVGRM
jgi:hypothetical protein